MKALAAHPAERVDLEDFVHGTQTFPQGEIALANAKHLLDNQCRVTHGFRVEIPNQGDYPGRIVIHGGYGLDPTGQRLFDESYLTVSRTVTLEGATTDFYVEVEYLAVDTDSDARAFWDPTVDQGADPSGDSKPDGQEFGDTVATRKALDWRIATPISNSGFARDTNPSSTRVPVVKLSTNGSGEVIATTEKAGTVILEVVTTTPGKFRVQDAQHFLVGDVLVGADKTVAGEGDSIAFATPVCTLTDAGANFLASYIGQSITIAGSGSTNNGTFTITAVPSATSIEWSNAGGAAEVSFPGTWSISLQETKTVSVADAATGLITLTGNIATFHTPGEILRGTGSSAVNLLGESRFGRYLHPYVSIPADRRDRLFQGDEVHGGILAQGVDFELDRSDLNLKSLKDHVDFLAAQLEELKWGATNPVLSPLSVLRTPPGLATALASAPRYYDRAGGVQGARTASVTVGDGSASWGDFSGNTQAAIQAAIDYLPSDGGTVYVKRGSYSLASDLLIDKRVELICDAQTSFICNGGWLVVNSVASVILRNMRLIKGTSTNGLKLTGVPGYPYIFVMDTCLLYNVQMSVETNMNPINTFVQKCIFFANDASMASLPIVLTTSSYYTSGFWSDCVFYHSTATGLTGATWDAIAATQIFSNCTFATFLIGNVAGIDISSSYKVTFNMCKFGDSGTQVPIEVYCGNDAYDIKFNNCITKNGASLLKFEHSDGLIVDGCNFGTIVTSPGITIKNSSNITIINNRMLSITGGATGLTMSGIYFIVDTTHRTDNIKIANNVLVGNSDKAAGIIFWSDSSAATNTYNDLTIENNMFDMCEVPLYCEGATSHYFYRVTIQGNTFKDDSSLYQKLGIYCTTGAEYSRWSILNNRFSNFNPNNSNYVVGGAPFRSAVAILGNKTNFRLEGNSVSNVGKDTVNTIQVNAFDIPYIDSGYILRNSVMGVYSSDGSTTGSATVFNTGSMWNVQLNDNIVTYVKGELYVAIVELGQYAENCTFNRNIVTDSSAPNGSAVANIINQNQAVNGETTRIEVMGNKIEVTSTFNFVSFTVLSFNGVQIKDNQVGVTISIGVYISITTAGSISDVVIEGNTIYNHQSYGIYAYGAGTSIINRIIVKNNELYGDGNECIYIGNFNYGTIDENIIVQTASAKDGIYFIDGLMFTCSHNTIDHTAGGSCYNIQVGTGCDKYAINDNICDSSGGTPPTGSIYSASVTGTAGMMHDNLHDDTVTTAHSDDLLGNVSF